MISPLPLITDALMCPYRIGERVRALKLLRSVNESMLLMWDRGFHSLKPREVVQEIYPKGHCTLVVYTSLWLARLLDVERGSSL